MLLQSEQINDIVSTTMSADSKFTMLQMAHQQLFTMNELIIQMIKDNLQGNDLDRIKQNFELFRMFRENIAHMNTM